FFQAEDGIRDGHVTGVQTCALPISRGHRDDMRVLRWAVQTQARYIGMIGSKRKTIAIFRELTKEGIPAHLFERVHAPVGLDIGEIGRASCRERVYVSGVGVVGWKDR